MQKIGIRNARKDANNDLKKLSEISEDLQKNAEFDIQEMTDLYVKKIDDIFHLKEKRNYDSIIPSDITVAFFMC